MNVLTPISVLHVCVCVQFSKADSRSFLICGIQGLSILDILF